MTSRAALGYSRRYSLLPVPKQHMIAATFAHGLQVGNIQTIPYVKEICMNIGTTGIVLALVISSVAVFGADTPITGTWKQNLSKSKFTPGPGRTTPATLQIEGTQRGETITVNSVDMDGKPVSYSYKGLYDGTPQKISGSPYGDTVSLKRLDATSSEITWTRNGKVTRTSTRTVSKDGKTMTVSAKGTNAKGEQYSSVSVFEKQ
jgi:hypothetical protein